MLMLFNFTNCTKDPIRSDSSSIQEGHKLNKQEQAELKNNFEIFRTNDQTTAGSLCLFSEISPIYASSHYLPGESSSEIRIKTNIHGDYE